MGIDPQTHEPSPTPASPSTRHMAQWESARLEAEARLSRESLLSNPPILGRTSSDYFLRVWNSKVGEQFRNFHKGNKTTCQSPASQASSSTKCGSVSGTTMEMDVYIFGSYATGSAQNEDFMADSDSSISGDLEDSSDTALQLLLDFQANNDMSFLEHDDSHTLFPAISTESSFNCSTWGTDYSQLYVLEPSTAWICSFVLLFSMLFTRAYIISYILDLDLCHIYRR